MQHNTTSHRFGERFGRLTVLYADARSYPDRKTRWICLCDCGAVKSINGRYFRSGDTRSCGCWGDENRRRPEPRSLKHGLAGGKDGAHRPPEYHIWVGMRQRCRDVNLREYPRYGGRGIKVCAAWDDFAAFLRDMGLRPSAKHSIDRVDNDGPYAPWNCRWATAAEQMANRSNTPRLTYNGAVMRVADWAQVTGIPVSVLVDRMRLGWTDERALTQPYKPRRR